MTTVAVTSTRSSPGASSLAVGLSFAWNHMSLDPLLVEADPAGGVIGLRFDLAARPSLVTMSADIRRGFYPRLLQENTVDLRGVRCLLSPVDPIVSARVIERNAGVLARELPRFGVPTVIDIGRVAEHSPALPLARAADQVLLVSRPRLEEVQSLLFSARLLKSIGCAVSLVLIGDRPHYPEEVADWVDLPLAAVVPDNRALASALVGGQFSTRRLKRSLFWRSIAVLSATLLMIEPRSIEVPPPGPAREWEAVNQGPKRGDSARAEESAGALTPSELASFPPPTTSSRTGSADPLPPSLSSRSGSALRPATPSDLEGVEVNR